MNQSRDEKKLTKLEMAFSFVLLIYFVVILVVLFLFNFLPLDKEIALKFFDISQYVLPTLVLASGITFYRAKHLEKNRKAE